MNKLAFVLSGVSFSFVACHEASSSPQLALTDPATGIHVEASQQNAPALKILLPGQPVSDPGILVLFPEHVTAQEHGKSEAVHLYLSSSPDSLIPHPSWRRAGQSLEYEMDLQAGVNLIARATLEPDGVRFHYDFINHSAASYDTIQAVTDPRMITPYFHDARLERTYVHHSGGFDLLASETPARLTMPLSEWLPNRYRVSYTWPIDPNRVEKKEDGLTWYNKSRRVDEPFLATKTTDGKWVMAAYSAAPGNIWTNPELTCQHADMQTSLPPNSQSSTELKLFLFPGTLDDLLAKVHAQNSSRNSPASLVSRRVQNQTIVSSELPAADLTPSPGFHYAGAQVVKLYGDGPEPTSEAEQHLFVEEDSGSQQINGRVKRFYWIQFEHRLPGNTYTYNYKLPATTDFGGLSFVYDTKAFLDYDSDMQSDPRSDLAAIARLLAQHHLAFPKNVARVRMFHLPTPDRRSELMIIYGESLLQNSKIPATTKGVLLDETSPESAKLLLEHAKQALTIRKH